MKLAEQTCSTNIGSSPLSGRQVAGLLPQVPGWSLSGRELRREFRLKDFQQALVLVNAVARLADEQGHYPAIHVFSNTVCFVLTTPALGALSMNDFILAARINLLSEPG